MKPSAWLQWGYTLLFALLPWSIDQDFGGWNMSLPTEPIIGSLGIALAVLFWQNPGPFIRIFKENLFLKISFSLMVWMAISAGFSSLPMVSWKYWIVSVAYWWVFAFGITVWPCIWRRAFPWFILSMIGLSCYTLIHHAFYHFRTDQAMLAPMPFFPDHTMLAAAISMCLLLLGTLTCLPGIDIRNRLGFKTGSPLGPAEGKGLCRFKPSLIAIVLLFALVLIDSTCRAAWASLLLAAGLWCLVTYRNKWLYVLFLSLFVALWAGLHFSNLLNKDVSTLERLNRWSCALRMAQERPVQGFGPGTFKFGYLEFQQPQEMTRISLQQPILKRGPDNYGRGGGAHSEYLQALAETGWPGLILLVCLVLSSIWSGLKNSNRRFSRPFLLAMATFWVHGAVNDFLHDDCIAALVWGSMAMLSTLKKNNEACLDIRED